ncbi:phage tail assembly protein [Bosea thiooxidans]
MSEPDLSPVKPYPGYPGLAAAEATPAAGPGLGFGRTPEISPAVPEAWSTTVPLEHALLVDGENLAVIAIRRPTGSDIAELMEQDPDEATLPIRLRARICGVHPAVFAALAADDSERVADALVPFLPRAILALEEALARDGASD